LSNLFQRKTIGFPSKLFQVIDVLRVVDQLIVVADVEAKLLLWTRDGGLRQQGKEHKKHKRHKKRKSVISCASCASCVPSACYHRKGMITLNRVSKVFEGKRKATALENINLEIEKGQVVSIVGPSGSGKSTLLNLIGGLDRPSSGEISIEGEKLSQLPDD